MNSLEKERQRVKKLGKEKFIKELTSNYKKFVNKLSVLDIIKDHLEYYPKYQDLKMLNKLRKMKTKEARDFYVKFYKNNLKKQSFKTLIQENV